MQKSTYELPDFRALLEGAPNLYLILTAEFQIVGVSDAYCRATMTRREDIVGHGLFEIFPDNPDDPAADGTRNLKASLDRVLALKRPDMMAVQKYDIQRPASEGGGFEERFWSPLNTPVLGPDGRVAWIIHRAEDVTDLVRLQTRSEEWDRLTRDQQGTIAEMREANRALALQLEENAKLQRRVLVRTEELQSEVAARRKTEDALRRTSTMLDSVIEHVPAMLFVKDAKELRFTLLNKAAEELMGVDRAKLIGKTDYDVFPKSEADFFRERDRRVLDQGEIVVTPEEPLTTESRGTRLIRTVKVPIKDENGEPRFMLGFALDITDQRSTEQALRQATKMEAVGQLTGGIAHDFNNLLGVVIGNLDLLLDRVEQDPAMKELAEQALESAQHGAELTQRLLAFSRKQPLKAQVIDLNARMPQIASMLRRTLGEQIAVEIHPSPDLWRAMADGAQVEEAILNLSINARDAMPRGGVLGIETANVQLDAEYAALNAEVTPGDYAMVAISDTGIGMTPEVVEKAFEPFFTTKEAGKGTGLGLSMVYGFIKQSGGHIKIYSEPGHGTTIKLYLPRADSDRPAVPAPQPASDDGEPRGDELILVTEDNAAMRAVVANQLAELGYRALQAESAKDALALLRANPRIDLLLSDVVMRGGMTGYELANEARVMRPALKILLMSGYTAQAAQSGHHDARLELLSKPFRKRDLAVKLREVLGQRP